MIFPTHFQKNWLALLVGLAFVPHGAAQELDFAQSPPGAVEAYVAPNVILSLDDSGSMAWDMNGTKGGHPSRASILSNALQDVFNDKELLPDGKIRLAWQSMHGNTQVNGLTFKSLSGALASDNSAANVMRSLEGTHRDNFLKYAKNFKANNGTPTHRVVRQADAYMRGSIHKNGPWADIPGEKLVNDPKGKRSKPLGCRRNYHILMTDGEWNTYDSNDMAIGNYSGKSRSLPNGVQYSTSNPQTQLYRVPSSNYFTTRVEYVYADGSHAYYKDVNDINAKTTIADWAMKSWAEPLQSASQFEGALKPLSEFTNAPDTETITNRHTGVSFEFEKFWNPKYDPADWPHMSTFTIGFSNAAVPTKNYLKGGGSTIPMKQPTSNSVPFGYDGDLAEYARGTYEWYAGKHQQLDMWHAALNGRGKFYSVTKGEDLKKAFRDIIQSINTTVEPAVSSTAAGGSNAQRHDVFLFTASYDPGKSWSGEIKAQNFKSDGSGVEEAWNGQSTAQKLDALSNVSSRVILTAKAKDWENRVGVAFKWGSLGDDEKYSLGSADAQPVADNGEKIVNYLRGERTLEGGTKDKPFRERSSRQGDIVNSDIWYIAEPVDRTNYSRPGYAAFASAAAKRTPMIYVGGNDGMLHGFSAKDGTEKIAYVPHGLLSQVSQLSRTEYNNNHRYFVDGSPFSGDIYDGSQWKTMLVGALGAGGKGYFVLDITDPDTFSESKAAQLVVKDMTLPPDMNAGMEEPGSGYLGHIFAKPVMDDDNPQRTVQIARLNNDRWAAILGNGYGSSNGQAALLIQYLDGKKELHVIPTDRAPVAEGVAPNGLSAPRLVDINGDGRPDVVYAGDLQGNLWKFLINTKDDNTWGVATWQPKGERGPLFVAERGAGSSAHMNNTKRQPITTAPAVKISERQKRTANGIEPAVGMMVSFGTGRNVTVQDAGEQQQQTLYAVLDNTRYKLERDGSDKPTGRVLVCDSDAPPCDKLVKDSGDYPYAVKQADLLQRTIPDAAAHERDNRKFWTIDDTTELDFASKKGWFMDLPMKGERLLKNVPFYDGSNLLMVMSQVPASGAAVDDGVESCDSSSVSGEKQFVTLVNIQDGKAPREPLIKDATIDKNLTRFEAPPGGLLGLYATVGGGTPGSGSGSPSFSLFSPDGATDPTKREDISLMREEPLRPNWRQIQ